MMKLLWVSNSPHTRTGYGNQTGLFAPLIARDHDLTIFAYYGVEGSPIHTRDYTILPRAYDSWGNDIVAAHCAAHQIDLVITLTDVWVLDPDVYGSLNWLAWTPIDHDPMPPAVETVLRSARWAVAMSKFGQNAMQHVSIEATYIPHAVDTHIFHPLDRKLARQKMGWESGRFIAMMNAANKGDPSRKGFREVLQAWREFVNVEPTALLYLHTERLGRYGVPLQEVVSLLRLEKNVEFVDDYRYATGQITLDELNFAYNGADVLLNPSMGEGFGIPILEAQAAGCPVIVTDFTAMPELCWAGWQVPGSPFMTYQHSMQVIPSVPHLVEALRQAKQHQGDEKLRQLAVEGAQAYEVNTVYATYWQPLLQRIQVDLMAKAA